MSRTISGILGLAFSATFLCGGCATVNSFVDRVTGKPEPQEVTPNQFIQPPSHSQSNPNGVDQAGAIPDNPRLSESFQPVLPPLPAAPQPRPRDSALSESIIQDERQSAAAATQPTTGPVANSSQTATEPSAASGEYMPLGGVVAEVNGTPIYLNKVLRLVWPSIHNFAKEYGPDQFASAARNEIMRQIHVLINSELQFAAAQQNLDDSDKRLVTALTAVYRQRLINDAGGSLELARRKVEANGENFDEMMEDKYRDNMIFVYLQRKLVPLLAPSALEMRQYYEEHLDKDFTSHSAAQFDLLAINPANIAAATPEEAKTIAYGRAKQAHDRAVAGENFAAIFSDLNNDPGINALTNGTGDMGTKERGELTIQELDDAVWKLKPGQVSDVLEINGELYLAKMIKFTQGSVRSFDSEDVQNEIKEIITNARRNKLIDDERNRLLSEAIYPTDEEMGPSVDTAVDMAMRSYRIWNQK